MIRPILFTCLLAFGQTCCAQTDLWSGRPHLQVNGDNASFSWVLPRRFPANLEVSSAVVVNGELRVEFAAPVLAPPADLPESTQKPEPPEKSVLVPEVKHRTCTTGQCRQPPTSHFRFRFRRR